MSVEEVSERLALEANSLHIPHFSTLPIIPWEWAFSLLGSILGNFRSWELSLPRCLLSPSRSQESQRNMSVRQREGKPGFVFSSKTPPEWHLRWTGGGSQQSTVSSGVFRMCERRGPRGSGGRKSPSGLQGQSPGRGSGGQSPPEAEAFLLMNA